jgi:sulfur carrier protein ThiS
MSEGTFHKMASSNKRLYGPKGLLICGFPPTEHAPLADALDQIGFNDRPYIFAVEKDLAKTLKEVFSAEGRSGMGHLSTMHRAIIMSGFLQSEVHTLMSAFRQAGLPRQLWATVTPVSENWTLAALLTELAEEDRAMQQKRPEKKDR